MSLYASQPQNKTLLISASASSAQAYLDVGNNNSITTILVTNADATNTAFINWSATSSTVTATTAGFPVPPYYPATIQVNAAGNFDSNITVAAVTASGTANVYITPVIYLG